MDRRASSPPLTPRQTGLWLRQQLATAEDTGYFGPESIIWQVQREAVLGLGLGRALLLQVAHPFVAQAVLDHSTFRSQPVDRLMATVTAAEMLIFGSRRQADEAVARIRSVHDHINGVLKEDVGRWSAGTPYTAHDPDALLWVLATLMDTLLLLYEAAIAPLPDRTVETFLAEAGQVGAMIGVRPEQVPTSRTSLRAYMDDMMASGTVAVGENALYLARPILYVPLRPWLRLTLWPYRAAGRAISAATMPEPLRTQYSSILPRPRPRLWRALHRSGRRVLHRLPDRMRHDPIAAVAMHRAEQSERLHGGCSHESSLYQPPPV
jgi:uncharacterized protein (DUF2236 family)